MIFFAFMVLLSHTSTEPPSASKGKGQRSAEFHLFLKRVNSSLAYNLYFPPSSLGLTPGAPGLF